MPGSSPLTRGRRVAAGLLTRRARLIPAHAGSTHPRAPERRHDRAHPRSRGVDICRRAFSRSLRGSSPLTRGRRSHEPYPPRRPRAHPRSRGVDCASRPPSQTPRGSSPLTRGRRRVRPGRRHRRGLIPAHAGSTTTSPTYPHASSAHPRSRGVDGLSTVTRRVRSGSSPLTRGRQVQWSTASGGGGLIPAHAGSTRVPVAFMVPTPAHPRSRGVDYLPAADTVPIWGSSPLTRGRPRRCHQERKHWRLIPAHAGSTSYPSLDSLGKPAHPRSRGVDLACLETLRVLDGSSPLTRGRPRRCHQERLHWRLIPAHAGSTLGKRWNFKQASERVGRIPLLLT